MTCREPLMCSTSFQTGALCERRLLSRVSEKENAKLSQRSQCDVPYTALDREIRDYAENESHQATQLRSS